MNVEGKFPCPIIAILYFQNHLETFIVSVVKGFALYLLQVQG